LEDLARETGVAERVTFLGWRDDRAALLKAATVVAFPSRYEPFGTVTVDAWAANVPLVAAAAAGPKEYVKDGVNGLLVEIDDVAALAAALNRIIRNPDVARKLAAGGRTTYEAQFTKEVFIRDSVAFYERILKERQAFQG
jgi:glycosyltransferase involved in cell wall biosynthesis